MKKYPILGDLYFLLGEYHRIIFSQKGDELEGWIVQVSSLKINELDTYINDLQADIDAIKNAICYKYNNGLAEDSVSKIELTKFGENLVNDYEKTDKMEKATAEQENQIKTQL